MKLLNIGITLTGLTTMALGSAVSHNVLLDCTDRNEGVIACASYNTNKVFQCNRLRWHSIGICFDSKFPCINVACILSPDAIEKRKPECDAGQKRCLTAFDRGHDGIQICKNGTWEMLDPCRCNRDPEPQCMPIVSRDIIDPRQCTEGEQKCMLRNEDGNGGTLFRCNNGSWKTQMHCRPSERCHDSPNFSTCSWLDAAAVSEDEDIPTTQIRRDNEPVKEHDPGYVCTEGKKMCFVNCGLPAYTFAVYLCENNTFKVSKDCGETHCTWDLRGPHCDDGIIIGLAEATHKA